MREPEFEDIQQELSIGQLATEANMQRRTFLKLLGAGATVASMPGWMQEMASAAPSLGANDGVIVVIQMGGGNDGLNTLVPIGQSAYYTARKTLAVSQASTLPIDSNVALHPSLVNIKAKYDAGQVAIVQGVGWGNNDLSHFDCTANWMSGWSPTVAPNASQMTGWLGRYLDGLGTDPLYGLSVGSSTPLHMVGANTAASALGTSAGGLFFGGAKLDAPTGRLVNTLEAMGTVATGYGSVVDTIATTNAESIGTSQSVAACYTPALPSGALNVQLALVARLINANLGTRVYGVSWGSFDTHENQASQHAARLTELDTAIQTFFSTLSGDFANRVTLMTFSEFGRRVNVNGSNGTDHGTASPLFVLGNRVKGGLYGTYPSLTNLDSSGNLRPSVDFHQVYATILDKWMNADSTQLLGSSYTDLDLFTGGPIGTNIANPGGTTSPLTPAPTTPAIPSNRPISFPRAYRIVTASGAVKSYGGADSYGTTPTNANIAALAITPDQRGYWMTSKDGAVFSYGDAPFHGGANTLKMNAPIVGMTSTVTGNGYWLLGQDGGIFSYGDAAFYGSTGGIKLNKPVVGMAASPNGRGYWLVASDGGIFAYGDARFFGSTGSIKLNSPIVGMAATPDGNGYWLVASDGGIFAYGDAQFYGSTGGIHLNKPIVGMAGTPTGRGYRLVASDGGVFCFGDATFEGSTGGSGSGSPVIGILT